MKGLHCPDLKTTQEFDFEDEPVAAFTCREGGPWIEETGSKKLMLSEIVTCPIRKVFAKGLVWGRFVHSVKTESGKIYDPINGRREI